MSFCSRKALAAHEALAGTGVRADAYVFLPVAKGLWGEQEINDRWASSVERQAIAQARRGGVVTRLYSPPRSAEPARDAVLVHLTPDRPKPEALQPLLDAFSGRWPLETTPRPRLAVCTHGTRDRCCAKFGFAIYNTARKLFDQGQSPFEPLECSHLGGDRYAATGVFFPSGSMYAHLDSIDLRTLIAAEVAGRLEPAHYRGRVFEAPRTQVVRAGLARDGLFNDTVAPLRINDPEPGASTLRVTADGQQFEVTLGAVEVSFYASCEKLAQHRAATARRTVYTGAQRLEPT